MIRIHSLRGENIMQTRTIDFSATNPYPEKKNWLSLFHSFLSSSSSSANWVGKVILPAQMRKAATENIAAIQRELLENYLVRAESLTVATHDGALLDTFQLTPTATEISGIHDRFYIIKFNGNGMHYEDVLKGFVNDAKRLDATVVAFNYRGVGNSTKTPSSFQELITDGIAQVQRLLESGVNPAHITLDGLSLGGAVATMVAHYFHNKDLRVSLWNDRSFQSVSKAAAGLFAPNYPGLLGDAAFSSLESTSWAALSSTRWQENIAAAYNRSPAAYKGYMVVDKQSGDGVIAHKASLHRGVKEHEKNHTKTGFKVFSQSDQPGHNQYRGDLMSKDEPNKNGNDLFDDFVRKNRAF
jgi:pimeloyl-ACP methyl ester carboxylesterase